jgi:acyl carrier protein
MPEVLDTVMGIFAEYVPAMESINDATLVDEIDIDSVDTLELIMKIEDAFDIELDVAAVENCKSVGDIVALVRQSMK